MDCDGQVIGIVHGEIGPHTIESYFFDRGALTRFERGQLGSLPRKVQEILKEGRVKASVLIDSDGGSALSALGFRNYLKKFKEREGSVSTYGFNRFLSGAARLWTVGDERFCAQDSIGGWHEPQFEDDAVPSDEIQRDYAAIRATARADIREFILSLSPGEALLRMAEEDPEGRFTMSLPGALLHRWGGATKAFPDHAATFRHFCEETGWEPSRWKFMTDPVGQFVRSTLTWKGAVSLL